MNPKLAKLGFVEMNKDFQESRSSFWLSKLKTSESWLNIDYLNQLKSILGTIDNSEKIDINTVDQFSDMLMWFMDYDRFHMDLPVKQYKALTAKDVKLRFWWLNFVIDQIRESASKLFELSGDVKNNQTNIDTTIEKIQSCIGLIDDKIYANKTKIFPTLLVKCLSAQEIADQDLASKKLRPTMCTWAWRFKFL